MGCEEKCILYSGQLVQEQSGKGVVALSGTVFSEIVVWRADKDLAGEISGEPVEATCMHRLQGHEGVIFSVQYCPTLSLICSTSDDRTARLWQVRLDGAGDWACADITASHVLRGHSARVFRSCFLGGSVVTGGEDSKICVWSAESGLLTEERAAYAPVWSLCELFLMRIFIWFAYLAILSRHGCV